MKYSQIGNGFFTFIDYNESVLSRMSHEAHETAHTGAAGIGGEYKARGQIPGL
jgi:hypothetical protein